jgi:endonuclease/exonuclease/phosphatase family metal-dependent hydrolase
VLGSQHTAGPGGLGPGVDRAAREARLLIDRGADVIGLQEVQVDQLHVFVNQMPGYTVWPQETLGANSYRLQLVFRDDRFEMIDSGSISYTFDNRRIPLPYALLRDRDTGAETWVAVTHNSPGGMQRERELSTAIEGQLVGQLASDPERPVLLLGDLNEHTEVVCRLGRITPVITANGAAASGSGCQAPSTEVRIDWIIGTPGVAFEGYVQDAAPRMGGMSDHYLILATATVSTRVLRVPKAR